MATHGKHPGGRPSKDKLRRTYTLDRKIVEYIDNLDDGDRSEFVNAVLSEGIGRRKSRESRYIEVRLQKDQIHLQDIICDTCEEAGKTWGFPTPREPGVFIMSIPASMDTEFLDELGIEHKLVQYQHD